MNLKLRKITWILVVIFCPIFVSFFLFFFWAISIALWRAVLNSRAKSEIVEQTASYKFSSNSHLTLLTSDRPGGKVRDAEPSQIFTVANLQPLPYCLYDQRMLCSFLHEWRQFVVQIVRKVVLLFEHSQELPAIAALILQVANSCRRTFPVYSSWARHGTKFSKKNITPCPRCESSRNSWLWKITVSFVKRKYIESASFFSIITCGFCWWGVIFRCKKGKSINR